MRHQSSTRHFNRDTKARQALMVSLVSNLLVSGKIVTTRPMAKEARKQVEKLITKAKKGDLTARRTLHKFFGKRKQVNILIEQVAPAFANRESGYTKITSYGQRRGDNAELYVLEFTETIELAKKEIAGARKMGGQKKTALGGKAKKVKKEAETRVAGEKTSARAMRTSEKKVSQRKSK